jgi:hypothetical protein
MMPYKRVAISAGHSTKCRGAADILDEVDEAWRVVRRVGSVLETRGIKAWTFQDTASTDQQTNLETICAWHNSLDRELDVSVHFNSTGEGRRSGPIGTECWYVTQEVLAGLVASAISVSGLIDRGPKHSGDLYFLNHTDMPAILVEVCFVDSEADAAIYRRAFNLICNAIVDAIMGEGYTMPPPPFRPPGAVIFDVTGKMSTFGGPDDMGVAPDEGLAFIHQTADQPSLFLPQQPFGTTGLARRLDPEQMYVACRWDYARTPRDMLLKHRALVRVPGTTKAMPALPADWGPGEQTSRAADLSPGLAQLLGLDTNDVVQVTFPFTEDLPAVPAAPRVEVALTVPDGVEVSVTVNGLEVTEK